MVTFNYLEPSKTRLLLAIDYEPQGPVESTGAALGVLGRRVKGDLERFKHFIEDRGPSGETGAWRGSIEDHPDVSGSQS